MRDEHENRLDELMPIYEYPVKLSAGLESAGKVMQHWRTNIDILLSLSPEEKAADSSTIENYARWFIAHAQRRGRLTYWNVLEDERMPSDARADFIKMPTCIALSTLNILRRYLNDNDQLQSDIDKIFLSTSLFILKQHGLVGNGYDMYDYMCRFIEVLELGGVIAEWVDREDEFGEIVEFLRNTGRSLIDSPENWTGTEAGYYALSAQQVAAATSALKPAISGGE